MTTSPKQTKLTVMEKKRIYAFDFDGTLTTKDTLIEFIRFARGNAALLWGLFIHSPLLVLMKFGLYPNGKAKQRLFSYFFKGVSVDEMGNFCTHFAKNAAQILRADRMKMLQEKLDEGATVVIVSASIEDWVREFFPQHPDLHVIGTQIEVVNNELTGKFSTPNCYGEEKVRRLCAHFPDRTNYHLVAFGDSRGDRELLAFADEGYLLKD